MENKELVIKNDNTTKNEKEIKQPNLYIIHDSSYVMTDMHKTHAALLNYSLLDVKNEKENRNSDKKIYLLLDINKLLNYIPNEYHQMLKIFDSKKLFAEYMIQNRLSDCIPKTQFSSPSKYPCIMKPIHGSSGNNTHIFRTVKDYEKSKVKYDEKYIIQDYIFAPYANVAHILCDRGNIILNIVYTAPQPNTYYIKKGRIRDYKKRELTQKEYSIFQRTLGSINYHGICSIDYVYDRYNNLKIFEINPRMGGSLFLDNNDFLFFITQMEKNRIYYT